ncbi:DUF6379 domain-containing protein [Ligilactobacillus agilis]|uniref:C-glycoside deglycosidase beta subunit domain-containing protein n=1 Tax=Ligilactobacillus agilis TaxID=1601 RepID=UPI001437739A|nr:DUF6379 domain-containing protein [Ligilactobacillus agilis]GET09967.1 hypothetical protein SN10121_04570 [Ligilactobacillus agilis]GET19357.1 hypothetical protein PTL465_16750 [Ligilactobacillus agilis]
MFDENVFIKGSARNVVENGKTIGFQMKTHITYYRGIPLSMVRKPHVWIDGQEVAEENIRFSVDEEEWFTLEEMRTVADLKWEYGQPATVRVLMDGGLKGKHKIKLNIVTVTAYIPVPLSGFKEYEVDFG